MKRGCRAGERGAAMLEVVVVATFVAALAAMAAPLTAQAADRVRVGGAARYLASLIRASRTHAIAANRATAMVFDDGGGTWRFRRCEDGNGNGVRGNDIDGGTDPCLNPAEAVSQRFAGVQLGLAPGVPDLDGSGENPAGVRFGRSGMVSCSPIGHCTPGTLYVRSSRGVHLAVRVSGIAGRTRLFRFEAGARRWEPE